MNVSVFKFCVYIFIGIALSNDCSNNTAVLPCEPYMNDEYNTCRAVNILQYKFYDNILKEWKDNGGWWNTANTVESLINFLYVSESNYTDWINIVYDVMNAQAVDRHRLEGGWDDIQWWSLSLIRLYEYTSKYNIPNQNASYYLEKGIFWFDYVWDNAWDNVTCDGGLWWNRAETYKNAITNELGLMNSIKIYSLTNNSEYLNRFNKIWYWFYKYNNSGIYMINNKWLINDGLNINKSNINICNNNNGLTWTYNQGVILGSLSKAYLITNNNTFIQIAWNIIQSVIQHLTINNTLHEPESNEAVGQSSDQSQFKGIFIRYLFYFYTDLFIDTNYSNNTIKNGIESFIKLQIHSIKSNCENPNCFNQFGDIWTISFNNNNAWPYGTKSTAQSISIDLLNWNFIM